MAKKNTPPPVTPVDQPDELEQFAEMLADEFRARDRKLDAILAMLSKCDLNYQLLFAALTATREIVTDAAGQPVAIRVVAPPMAS